MINRYHKTDSAKSSTPQETQARQALGGFEIRRLKKVITY